MEQDFDLVLAVFALVLAIFAVPLGVAVFGAG